MQINKTSPYKKSVFIFRRDLRLSDNTALINAVLQSDSVIPCFIFDPQQVTETNKFCSMNAIQFMIHSLKDIQQELAKKDGHLYLFYGNSETIIEHLIQQKNIDALFINKDYTPFSINRDKKIAAICTKNNVVFHEYNDILLTPPEAIKNGSGNPYLIFKFFFNNALQLGTVPIAPFPETFHFYKGTIDFAKSNTVYNEILKEYYNTTLAVEGGRQEALSILNNLSCFKHYEQDRNIPSIKRTTLLSAHLKFGTISIREALHAINVTLGSNHPLIRQLFWRDFFTHTVFHFPNMLGKPLKEQYNTLTWSNNHNHFTQWCNGTTGFPIVDAGMRQLNKTGFMHNRVRMIVASFLVKDLHIDWRWGEKYFAQKLTDYDPAVNNGNWQWCASTGFDSQPYFRIFNPWLQQKKFDPDCLYIKEWIPELKNSDPKIIHHLFDPKKAVLKAYPKPIVDHAVESKKAAMQYRSNPICKP